MIYRFCGTHTETHQMILPKLKYIFKHKVIFQESNGLSLAVDKQVCSVVYRSAQSVNCTMVRPIR